MTFLNQDGWAGLMLTGSEVDARLPDVARIEERTYANATFQGIAYKRLASQASGWASADGSKRAVDVTTYDSYTADFCPSQTTLTTSHGTLVTQTTRATVASLAKNLHCLEAKVVQTGHHPDATLDFTQETDLVRNAAGRITQITMPGHSGAYVAQTVAYDTDNDVLSAAQPGHGATTVTYDPATKMIAKVTSPDGVVRTVAARDPVTDAVLDELTDRGGAQMHDGARFDGQERLVAKWSDADGSTATAPREAYSYLYATALTPAAVRVHALVDAKAQSYADTTELFTASQEKIGAARLHDSGWVLDGFVARSRAQGKRDTFAVATQPSSASLGALDYATLLGGAPARIEDDTTSTLGVDVATSTALHADVTKATSTAMSVGPDGMLARTTLVNGANATTTKLDAAAKLTVAYVDEAGTAWGYVYDALGRLRYVALPDGAHHAVTYDEYGRVATIVRDGIARIASDYTPATGGGTTDLVAAKTYGSAPASGASVPQRKTAFTYDAAGRKLVETDTDLTNAATKTFAFTYDAPLKGLLSGVTGAGYSKAFAYRADGKLVHRTVSIDGYRKVDTDLAYRVDGSVSDRTTTVRDPAGNVLTTSAHHEDVDAYGRAASASLNGAPLWSTSFDSLGRPAATTFATGDAVTFAYDGLTRAFVGFDESRAASGGWSGPATTRVKYDARGFVGSEVLGVGGSRVQRAYTYSPQGFLVQAIDGSLQ
jgi:YD repeat-containing protein